MKKKSVKKVEQPEKKTTYQNFYTFAIYYQDKPNTAVISEKLKFDFMSNAIKEAKKLLANSFIDKIDILHIRSRVTVSTPLSLNKKVKITVFDNYGQKR